MQPWEKFLFFSLHMPAAAAHTSEPVSQAQDVESNEGMM